MGVGVVGDVVFVVVLGVGEGVGGVFIFFVKG